MLYAMVMIQPNADTRQSRWWITTSGFWEVPERFFQWKSESRDGGRKGEFINFFQAHNFSVHCNYSKGYSGSCGMGPIVVTGFDEGLERKTANSFLGVGGGATGILFKSKGSAGAIG